MDFPGEIAAVREAVSAGSRYGYGNIIDRLQIAWALQLRQDGFSWEAAARGAGLDKERTVRIVAMSVKDEAALVRSLKEYTGQDV